jgi:hypothetical protein
MGNTKTATPPQPQYLADPELAQLLKDLHDFLRRFVVFTSWYQSWAVVLWIAHTYVYQQFDATPRLVTERELVGAQAISAVVFLPSLPHAGCSAFLPTATGNFLPAG